MQKKVKVLYLVTESEWAGASRYVFDLATHLPPEFEPVVAAAGRGDVLDALDKKGVKTIRLRWLPRTIKPLKDFLAFWEILFLYFRERPNIIHLNSSKAGWLGSVAGAAYKAVRYAAGLPRRWPTLGARNDGTVGVIFTVHGWVFNEPRRANWFFRWLERFASYCRDVIICVSENDRREALRWRIAPPHKLVTIHNGIDVVAMKFLDRESARQKLFDLGAAAHNGIATPLTLKGSRGKLNEFAAPAGARNDDVFFIGTVANFYPNKGLEYLIEAFSLIKKETKIHDSYFMIQAVIIGDGPERPRMEALIKKHDLHGRIFLLGKIPEAWRYLKAFDCFVLPSIKEGLPYVILEALAAGVPVVATAVGGIPEIEGVITLVPPLDPQALAEATAGVLENISTHNSSLSSEFSLNTMLKKTLALYEKT